MDREHSPLTEIQIRLGGHSGQWLNTHAESARFLVDRLADVTREIVDRLGIPGSVEMELMDQDGALKNDPAYAEQDFQSEWFSLQVNGSPCAVTLAQAGRASAWTIRHRPYPWTDWQEVDSWLAGLLVSDEGGKRAQAAEFISTLCVEGLLHHCQLLLTLAHADACRQELLSYLDDSQTLPPGGQILPALQLVLEARLSLRDRARLAHHLIQSLGNTPQPLDVGEYLRNALRATSIEILIHPDTLMQITLTDASTESQALGPSGESLHYTRFTRLRTELFLVRGQFFPPFQFVASERMPAGTFAFRIGDIPGTPWVGEDPGEATDVMDYMLLCLASELDENRQCFVDLTLVQTLIDQIASVQPWLVELTRHHIRNEETTRVLRALVKQNQSLHNLRLILEALVCFDTIQIDPTDRWVPGERMPVLQTTIPGTPEYTRQLTDFVIWWQARSVNPVLIGLAQAQASVEPGLSRVERYAEPSAEKTRYEVLMSMYPRDEILKIIPLILMAIPGAAANANENIRNSLVEFAEKIEYKADMNQEELFTRINKYYQQNPVDPELLNGVVFALLNEVPPSLDAYTIEESFRYWPWQLS